MLTGIDHLVIASLDPDAAAAALQTKLGLAAGGGGRHERLGTFNRLVWLGDSYVELVGVFDRELAETSWLGIPTLRALAASGGAGGLATWAVATDALDTDVGDLRAAGAELADPVGGERMRPDGRLVRWRLAAQRRLGPTDPPFLIERDPHSAEWTPDERSARLAETHPLGAPVRLEALEIPVEDPPRAALRYLAGARIGPFRPSLAGRGTREASIGRQTLRLRREPGPHARPTIRLRAEGGPREVERAADLLGCRWVLRGG